MFFPWTVQSTDRAVNPSLLVSMVANFNVLCYQVHKDFEALTAELQRSSSSLNGEFLFHKSFGLFSTFHLHLRFPIIFLFPHRKCFMICAYHIFTAGSGLTIGCHALTFPNYRLFPESLLSCCPCSPGRNSTCCDHLELTLNLPSYEVTL